MKLTREEQEEVLKVYDTWLNSYLNGDVKTYDSFLDDEYRFIGSTDNEDFLNRKDTTKFFEATADQLAGRVEIRNSRKTIEKFDALFFITDLFDAYFLNGNDWKYYGKFRFSSTLKKHKTGWHFIYQHFSTPDSKAQEGETIGTEKIAAENLQLREAVKRHTIELENKNRELEIEASLERVRVVAMGMRNPDDILLTCEVMFAALQSLGFSDLRNTLINFWDDSSNSLIDYDYSDFTGANKAKIAYSSHPVFGQFQKRIRKSKDAFAKLVVKKEHLESWKQRRKDSGEYDDLRLNNVSELYYYFYSIGVGAVGISTFKPLTNDSLDLLKPFRNVFEFAYRRYMDVAQAEGQAREAQIETALERVRSRTMAMHQSEELLNVITVVSEQLQQLNFQFNTVSFAINNQEHDYKFWFAVKGHPTPIFIQVPYVNNPMFNRVKEALAKGPGFYTDTLTSEESRQWHKHVFANADLPFMTEKTKAYILRSGYARSIAIMPSIMLIVSNYATRPYSDSENDIIRKFATVFQQTYTRFLDLQKAEAQAREAQIEASLERVRAKAMAMHNTKDIESATAVVFNELTRLGIDMERCGIGIFNETKTAEIWSTPLSPLNKEVVNVITGQLDLEIHPLLQNFHQRWCERKDYSSYKLVGDEVQKYYNLLERQPGYHFPKIARYPDQQVTNTFYFKEGGIFVYMKDELSAETKNIFQRFTKVFEQTYTRFLDIQKAEKQAREAQIEAALERIRSRSMSMQSSNELSEVVRVMYDEVEKLEICNWGCALMIFDNKNKNIQLWFSENVNNQHARPYDFDNLNHELVRKWWDFWKNEDEFMSIHLKDEENDKWTNYLLENTGMKDLPKEVKEAIRSENEVYFEYAKMKQGLVSFINLEPFPEEIFPVLKRITRTFEQAYTRFLDVERAERLALETSRQASLDRIRAEIASMRSAEDLQQITPIIWDELKILEIPFIRCGIFIVDENKQNVEIYLSSPDGKSLAMMNLTFGANEMIIRAVEAWKTKQVYKDHWNQTDFINWSKSMIEKGLIKDIKTYQGGQAPPESLYLYFAPFSQGLLYVGAPENLNEEQLELIEALAKAIALAYARYEDFVQLENAKGDIENAMTELKSTQSQLIQAEKMASLGELTAGIAHEIQNPLNFVNNFSELSSELIVEIDEERAKNPESRDENLVSEVLSDIKQNLQKINHHGKRAADIVKGMLQHSRTNSGQKEPTDINALADEYLRLAYHGLRAKDKSFNADFKTDFDPALPKINVIPQDIGRVLLNLINNAFYAVSEKPRLQATSYKPQVIVSTKKVNTKIEIRVTDNGSGIPSSIKDKIFQPFFTTKPTGQGTGLGLSLSYDIVKAHGGELKVETKEGEGTEFIIQLPALNENIKN